MRAEPWVVRSIRSGLPARGGTCGRGPCACRAPAWTAAQAVGQVLVAGMSAAAGAPELAITSGDR